MAPVKRKADAESDGPVKAKKSQTGRERALKRRKSDAATEGNEARHASKPAASSMLQAEEKAFPRGGASVLTPLEHKQIQRQAEQDVLFEQSGAKGSAKARVGDEDESEVDFQSEKRTPKKRKKTKAAKENGAESKEEPVVKIESLNFKKLVPGTTVLAQVSQITSRDIVLALPNNLTGFVPLTGVSDQFFARVEKFANADEDDDDESLPEDASIDLHKLFISGQYLRATVSNNVSQTPVGSKAKKRIELSINPRDVNKGISKSEIVVNSMIQASVVSNEEHGLVMDLGLEDKAVRGFMSAKELSSFVKHENVQEGAVFLCLVTGSSSDGRVVKLSTSEKKTSEIKKNHLREAPSIDAFLPGTPIEMLVTHSTSHGLVGKIMGMLDATADIFHTGNLQDGSKTYSIGEKVKARVVCTCPDSEPRKVGISLLPHILRLGSPGNKDVTHSPLQKLPLSSFIDETKVVKVESSWGLVIDVGIEGVHGFVHISRVSDKRIDSLAEDSGPYAIGTTHRARVLGYSSMDGLLQLTFQESVLNQPFLRIEDIQNGQVVRGTVEKFQFTGQGTAGLRVQLAEGIIGFVPELHLADVQLQHPERKYREGMQVTARVLLVDSERRRVSLTLKKSIVNSEAEVWQDYETISVGAQSPGTITKLLSTGAEVHFFGRVKGWLHRSEMSEAYIADPTTHFRLGQTVNVRVLSVDPEKGGLKLSCRDPEAVSLEARRAFSAMSIGAVMKGSVLEKTSDTISIELEDGVKANLKLGHLTDKSEKKELSELGRIRVGQTIDDLIVLKKLEEKVVVILSRKPSLREAARTGSLIKAFEDVQEGQTVAGFVRHITPDQLFVEFAGGLSGALFKSQMTDEMLKLPDFGVRVTQSITTSVLHVDYSQRRFRLTLKSQVKDAKKEIKKNTSETPITNAIDGKTQFIEEYTLGKQTVARITSIKDTQLNVQLADNVQGRVDASEAFTGWDEITDTKHPLQKFKAKQEISVRVIGMHDARNHRFLPISHRQGRVPVFELSIKSLAGLPHSEELLTLENLAVGSNWTAFVNNHSSNCIWVNISPTIRGRILNVDLTDDISVLADIGKHFPIGSALQVDVKKVDSSAGHLDLIASKKVAPASLVTCDTLSIGEIVPGRVMKSTERSIIVSLSPTVIGMIPITEIADDYDDTNPTQFSKNEIVRVKIISIDAPNKRVVSSARPSNVLDSSIKPKDRQILSTSDLKINDILRGFVKNVTDKGLFISLGPSVTGFVRISDLSDSYIKDWKSAFKLDQLVTGKIVAVDPVINHVQMSLKQSLLDNDYVPPLTLEDLEVGQIVTGKVRKVEDFGVFVLVDNSNVSGLCHRSEMAEERVENVRALYQEGDKVKAIILKLDREKRRVNFGLKASYFQKETDQDDDTDEDSDLADGGVPLDIQEDSDSESELDDADSAHDDDDSDLAEAMDVDEIPDASAQFTGLKTSGFDWTGTNMDLDQGENASASESDDGASKKKRRRKPQIEVDRTGDLDLHGPRSVADFERLLLGQPHSSLLWISYMAFQLQLNEVEKAREIAQRALKTIDIREEEEKLQVRIALLNLENSFGSEESLENAFKEACQYHDERVVHDKLVGVYVQSAKTENADSLYSTMLTNKSFRSDPELWISYATFLLSTVNDPSRARSLLSRATQSVPAHLQRYLTSKFGALEFKSPNGDRERGRTIFEGLLSAYPRRWDTWDMYAELEDKHAEEGKVRDLYERMARTKMKKARAKKMFSAWAKWEEKKGNEKGASRARELEQEWMLKHEGQGEAEEPDE